MTGRWRGLLALVAVLAMLAAACGGDDSDDGGGTEAEATEADEGAATDEAEEPEATDEGDDAADDEGTEAAGGDEGGADVEVPDNPDQGVESDVIRIGWMGDVTGPTAAAQGFNLRGAEAAVAWVNENGGVLGRELELDVRDDQYSAEPATTNYQSLVNDAGVLAILNIGGAHISSALAPSIEADGVPIIGPPQSIDAQLEVPNFYNNLAHYGDEADAAVQYIGDTLGSVEDAVVAVVQLEIPSGDEWDLYIQDTLERLGGSYAGRVTMTAAATDFAGVVTQLGQLINSEGVNFIAFHGAPEHGLGIVSEMTTQGLDVPLVGIHGLAGASIYQEGPPEAAEMLAGAHSFVSPKSDCEMCATIQEFVAGTEWEDDVELNFSDGWSDILITVQAIERAAQESGELTWESMNAALTGGPFDIGGLSCDPDWSESTHVACAAVFRWNGEYMEPVGSFEDYADVIDGVYGLFEG